MLLHFYRSNTQICFKGIFYFSEENLSRNLMLVTALSYCIYFKIDARDCHEVCYCSTAFLRYNKIFWLSVWAIPSPCLRGEKHLQGEADYHGKAVREIKLIARSNDVTKRRANKLTDSNIFFLWEEKGHKLRYFVQNNAFQFW